jgi:GTP cyclohydrolase I
VTFEPKLVVSAPGMEPSRASVVDRTRAEGAVRELLDAIGEDASRAGLTETPRRVAESYAELFSGYGIDPVSILEPLPDEHVRGLVMVRDIRVVSLCEHHLLPFIGSAAVAYLPGERFTGLSKLARLIDVLSRRLQVQERLTGEAADALEEALAPRGVFVVVEAEHLCMSMRGARAPGTMTVTIEARGVFENDPAARAELLALARAAS